MATGTLFTRPTLRWTTLSSASGKEGIQIYNATPLYAADRGDERSDVRVRK